jgi:hypothetical protein
VRRLSKRTRATMRIERRAATIAAPLMDREVLMFDRLHRNGMTAAEDRGWDCHTRWLHGYTGPRAQPTGASGMAGWLAAEIWRSQ